MSEVWVTGMGVVSAAGYGPAAHSHALRAAETPMRETSFFENPSPVTCFAGIVPPTIIHPRFDRLGADRANRLLECAVSGALKDSGLTSNVRADMLFGATLGNMNAGTRYYRALRANERPSTRMLTYFAPAAPLKRIAQKQSIIGVHRTISSACASSAIALGRAFRRIRAGACDRVIAGGFDPLCPFVVAGFNSLRLLASGVCRPFDEQRDGLCPGEGGAALVLESARSAAGRAARARAVITGFGEALEGYHYTRSHPEGEGLVRAMSQALEQAMLKPHDIDHVHVHGTATNANDQSEYAACKRLFGERLSAAPVTSTKWITGHTFGAAGALSSCFAILALQEGFCAPVRTCRKPDPAFAGISICQKACRMPRMRRVMVTALGFGGEAAALIFEKPEAR